MTGTACISALKAMGDENRMRILRSLSQSPLSVSEIAARLDLAEYNVSKHLKILRQAGLLETSKQGKERHYGIPDKLREQLNVSVDVLNLGCCSFRLDRLPK